MTPNQRDMFMWTWSRSRKRGRLGMILLGAGIGAAGGLLFALILGSGIDFGATPGEIASNGLRLYGLSIPAFAGIGAFGIDRVYRSQESMYQHFIAQGATPPETKPTLTTAERGPMIAVFIAAGVMAAGIAALWIAYG